LKFDNENPEYSIELEYNSYTNNVTNVTAVEENYKDNRDIMMRLEFV